MPKVSLQGVSLDRLLAEFRREPPTLVGEQRPAFSGGLREDVSDRKDAWVGATKPITTMEADALRGLVEGAGVVGLPLSENSYSAQGDSLAAAATIAFTGAGGKHSGFGDVTTQAPRWPVNNQLINGVLRHNYSIFGFRVFTHGGGWDWFLYKTSTLAGPNLYWRSNFPTTLPYVRPAYDWFGVDANGAWYLNPPGIGSPPLWAASTAKALGNRITVTANGNVFYCSVAGTTGTVDPSWVSVIFGGTVVDGTVTWTNIGWATLRVCDLLYVPFLVPDSWVPELYAEHSARSLASWHTPRLAGDLIPGTPRTVVGQVLDSRSIKTAAGIREQVEFRLEER